MTWPSLLFQESANKPENKPKCKRPGQQQRHNGATSYTRELSKDLPFNPALLACEHTDWALHVRGVGEQNRAASHDLVIRAGFDLEVTKLCSLHGNRSLQIDSLARSGDAKLANMAFR